MHEATKVLHPHKTKSPRLTSSKHWLLIAIKVLELEMSQQRLGINSKTFDIHYFYNPPFSVTYRSPPPFSKSQNSCSFLVTHNSPFITRNKLLVVNMHLHLFEVWLGTKRHKLQLASTSTTHNQDHAHDILDDEPFDDLVWHIKKRCINSKSKIVDEVDLLKVPPTLHWRVVKKQL